MIQLSLLAGPSDLIAFISLAILASIFGLLPAERVMPMFLRKRREIALIWAVACMHRGAELLGLQSLTFGLHVTSAMVACLSASTAVLCLLRERQRAAG